jgi:hypothetical protein
VNVVKLVVSRTEVGKLLMVDPAELRPVFGNRRTMPLDEVIAGYINHLTAVPSEIGEMRGELAEQNRLLLVYGAEVRELRAELISGESFREVEVRDVIGARLAGFTAKFLVTGAKCAMRLVNKKPGFIESVLREEVLECTAELRPFDRNDLACPKLFFEDETKENGGQDP